MDRNPNLNFVLKVETVTITDDFTAALLGTPDMKTDCNSDAIREAIGSLKSLQLIESHGDCVIALPDGADLVGSSASCRHEIFFAGKYKSILACQSHPEFELQYAVLDRILPSVVRSERLSEIEKVEAMESFEKFDARFAKLFGRYIFYFLNS